MKYRLKIIEKNDGTFYVPQVRKFFIWWTIYYGGVLFTSDVNPLVESGEGFALERIEDHKNLQIKSILYKQV